MPFICLSNIRLGLPFLSIYQSPQGDECYSPTISHSSSLMTSQFFFNLREETETVRPCGNIFFFVFCVLGSISARRRKFPTSAIEVREYLYIDYLSQSPLGDKRKLPRVKQNLRQFFCVLSKFLRQKSCVAI